MSASYKVLYTKDTLKKRKAYQDGKFSVRKTVNDSCLFVLYDECDKEVKRVTDKASKFKVEVGTEFMFGAFGVQVEELVDGVDSEPALQQQQPSPLIPPLKKPFSKFSIKTNPVSVPNSGASTAVAYPSHTSLAVGSVSHPRKQVQQLHEAILDPSLAKVMRPHQVSGANFLLQRLSGSLSAESDSSSSSSDLTCRGAILADEVRSLPAVSLP
jgi:hypothetical protein